MGMSTHIVGFRPPDEQFKNMLSAYKACEAAGIDPPEKVVKFFNHVTPDEAGVEINLQYPKLHPCVKKWKSEDGDGFEINVTKLPEGLKILRVYNSW